MQGDVGLVPVFDRCQTVSRVAETTVQLQHDNDGGVYCRSSSNPTLTNCILWHDAPQEIYIYWSSPAVTYSNVQGGWTGVGNIDDDPLFVNPLGEDGIAGTTDDDLRLQVGSPCINMGDPQVVLSPGEADLDGHARVLCDRVDMGAYEFGIGNHDCDFDVNLGDFSGCFSCITGPRRGPYTEGCEACDFDYDLDVDLFDFAGFQAALTLE